MAAPEVCCTVGGKLAFRWASSLSIEAPSFSGWRDKDPPTTSWKVRDISEFRDASHDSRTNVHIKQ